MNVLIKDNTQSLINALLEKGEDYTRKYLTDFLNRHVDSFNEFVQKCKDNEDSGAYYDDSYTIVSFNVGGTEITSTMMCVNYTFSSTRNKSKELRYYSTTHAYIDLNDNKFKFFQFGPNKEANIEHQQWLDEMLEREYKFMQLELD